MRGISEAFLMEKSPSGLARYTNVFEEQKTINFEIPGRHGRHIVFVTFDLAGQESPAPPYSIRVGFKSTQFRSGFVGENLTLEKFTSLDEEEKIYLKSTLWEMNEDWLNQRFQELNAAWITVVDGEVETSSPDIHKYPQEPDVLEICRKRGRFPFIFINNFPPPRNPFLAEEPQSIPPEVDPSFFEEERAFLQMKDSLYEKYPEKYIAIRNGKVVDSDEDNCKLAERVYKDTRVTIYIDKVTRESEIAHLSSPTTEW